MKQFVHDTVSEFDIGPDDTQLIVVISYDSSARVEFYLNTYENKTDLLSAINSLTFSSGGTNPAVPIDLLHNKQTLCGLQESKKIRKTFRYSQVL